ncbi:uncharacterized protein J4E92_008096 [Alternaria infectoria]|uniref:uncharacterized protein n=1 Tax=Alternaria infectoria TaxID=45303 RepID=UPI00221F731C|nr:uncharacterized protein J4E92_008096 [Alternaria infectoria]KAI4921111.1 hypothetical protein J4E92_008096 [Alternaria infectoria]
MAPERTAGSDEPLEKPTAGQSTSGHRFGSRGEFESQLLKQEQELRQEQVRLDGLEQELSDIMSKQSQVAVNEELERADEVAALASQLEQRISLAAPAQPQVEVPKIQHAVQDKLRELFVGDGNISQKLIDRAVEDKNALLEKFNGMEGDLETMKSELREESKTRAKLDAKVKRLSQAVKDKQKELDDSVRIETEIGTENAELGTSQQDWMARAGKADGDLSQRTADLKQLTEEREQLTKDLEQRTEDLKKRTDDLHKRTEELNACREALDDCRIELQSHSNQIEEMKTRTEDTEERIRKLNIRLDEVRQATSDARANAEVIDRQRIVAEKQVSSKEDIILKMQQELEQVHKQNELLEIQTATKEKELQGYRQRD